nr:MAG TPA: hypothetical protein [Caudoviricetes sp.]
MARRRKNISTQQNDDALEQEKKDEGGGGLVLSDPGTATTRDPHTPRIVNVTPDGRIRRVDF